MFPGCLASVRQTESTSDDHEVLLSDGHRVDRVGAPNTMKPSNRLVDLKKVGWLRGEKSSVNNAT